MAAPAGAKPKPNTIETHGEAKVKINEYIQDGQRFVPGDKQPVVEAGQPGFDTMGTKTTAGDSIFLPPKGKVTFKVTAKKGAKLTYFCAVHPWMRGTITVK